MKITTVGIDLAKNVFQLHSIDEHGKAVVKKQLRRDQMATFFVNLQPCLIGMEACGSEHHWARKLQSFGHTVRLMAPQFVKPYVKTNKNDAADSEAICEAVSRPNMPFVPVKDIEQQAVLALHRVRQGFVRARTAQANQIRGLLGEFGITIPQVIGYIATRVPSAHRAPARPPQGARSPTKRRSRLGIAVVTSVASLHRCRVLDRSRPVRWWPPLATQRTSTAVARLLLGSGSCPDNIRPAVSPICSA